MAHLHAHARSRRQGSARPCIVMLLAMVSLWSGMIVLVAGFGGCSSESNSSAAEMSEQQQQLIERFGSPDEFVIAFVSDEEGGQVGPATEHRRETWFYHRFRTNFSFVDGQFVASEPFVPSLLPLDAPTRTPVQFQAGMTWEDVRQALAINDYVYLDVDELNLQTPEIPKGLKVYVANALILGFAEDRLALVQSTATSLPNPLFQPDIPKGLFGQPK